MAERLFLARLPHGVPVRAASAGTNGLTGYAMDAPSALVLRELGGNPDGHTARRVTPALVDSASLVLTADSGHRAALLKESPLAFRRTFTLREFARLSAGRPPLSGATPASLAERVREVAAARGVTPAPERPGADDIGDPFGAPMDVVRASGAAVSDAVNAAIAGLGLVGVPGSPDAQEEASPDEVRKAGRPSPRPSNGSRRPRPSPR